MSIRLKTEKQMILNFLNNSRNADATKMKQNIAELYDPEATWYGSHPFGNLKGTEEIYEKFYKELLESFPTVKRDVNILFGGKSANEDWVVASGYFVANFDKTWLGIPCTQKCIWMRYAEHFQFKDGKVVESGLFLDILSVIRQSGIHIVPTLGPQILSPGPATCDGIVMYDTEPSEGEKTKKLIQDMCYEGLCELRDLEKTWEPDETTLGLMEKYWHQDMMWYGPDGIGTSKGIVGFERIHELPWEMSFKIRRSPVERVEVGEGNYAFLTSWPCQDVLHVGSCVFGYPATNKKIQVTLLDIWRREGNKLIENWIFIDIIDILNQMGIDVFDRIKNNRYILHSS